MATNSTTLCLGLLPVGAQVVVTGVPILTTLRKVWGYQPKCITFDSKPEPWRRWDIFTSEPCQSLDWQIHPLTPILLDSLQCHPHPLLPFSMLPAIWTRERMENGNNEALEEIRRQTRILAEFTERLRLLNLNDVSYSRVWNYISAEYRSNWFKVSVTSVYCSCIEREVVFIDLALSTFLQRLFASIISGSTPLSVARDVDPLLNDLEIP